MDKKMASIKFLLLVTWMTIMVSFLVGSALAIPPDGTLITGPERGTIWVIQNAEKHPIPNWDTFIGNGWSYDNVAHLSTPEIQAIPDGSPVPPAHYSIKNESCGLNGSNCTARCIATIEHAETHCNCIGGICNAICTCQPGAGP
jgi:hypothetical protein